MGQAATEKFPVRALSYKAVFSVRATKVASARLALICTPFITHHRECIKGTCTCTHPSTLHTQLCLVPVLRASNVSHNNQQFVCAISGLHSGFVAGSGRCDTTPLNSNLRKHNHIPTDGNIRRLSSNSINR
jgi:hypothetical protein